MIVLRDKVDIDDIMILGMMIIVCIRCLMMAGVAFQDGQCNRINQGISSSRYYILLVFSIIGDINCRLKSKHPLNLSFMLD